MKTSLKRMERNLEALPPAPPAPPESDAEFDWAQQHKDELIQAHPDQWVAIVGNQVVAAGKNLARVEQIAREKSGREEFTVLFIEEDIRVYTH